jgi:N-carbamoyl-L-amino-acid hydrolase
VTLSPPSRLQKLLTSRASVAQWLDSLARDIFDQLYRKTRGERGVTRASWGIGETIASDLLQSQARSLGLATRIDDIGNLYIELPGRDRTAPRWVSGSHLDSVPEGGNYDGAAGAVAALLALAIFKRTDIVPNRDLWAVGFRGEEASSWFTGRHNSHLGSRAALGVLPESELDSAIHRQSGLSFRRHLQQNGFDWPRSGAKADLQADSIRGFIELHIEQGPILIAKQLPVGIVTAIRGSLRARNGKVTGEYAHSGAVPHYLRKDAVFAAAEFARECEDLANRIRAAGEDVDVTFGQFATDTAAHGLTKVAGELHFTIDARSSSNAVLNRCKMEFQQIAKSVLDRRGLDIAIGDFAKSDPAIMDSDLIAMLQANARELSIPTMELPSGAGHDAADVARCGIPTAMIFVRNANGSHNPDESMEISDFLQGVWVLAATLTH